MPLSIRNPRAEKLAKEVASMSGENITQTIIHALENQLERLRGSRKYPDTVREIMNISRRCSSIPDKDTRSQNEILGYNKIGISK
jgi:antitoxin VapB